MEHAVVANTFKLMLIFSKASSGAKVEHYTFLNCFVFLLQSEKIHDKVRLC